MSTALIPLAPTDRGAPAGHASGRASANFIAQLVATATKAPQTRARRRAEPDEVIAAYAGTGERPQRTGRALSRSL